MWFITIVVMVRPTGTFACNAYSSMASVFFAVNQLAVVCAFEGKGHALRARSFGPNAWFSVNPTARLNAATSFARAAVGRAVLCTAGDDSAGWWQWHLPVLAKC